MDHFRLDEQGSLAAGARPKGADELRATPPPGGGDLPSAELAVAFERFQEACAHASKTLGELKRSLGELAEHQEATKSSRPKSLSVLAKWGSRRQEWSEVSDRAWKTVKRLNPISPLFAQPWMDLGSGAVCADKAQLAQAGWDDFSMNDGYIHLYTQSPGDDRVRAVKLSGWVGRTRPWGRSNSVQIGFELGGKLPLPPFPQDEILPIVSDLVSVLIDVWDPESVSFTSPELWRACYPSSSLTMLASSVLTTEWAREAR
jgi:hypothetical protein